MKELNTGLLKKTARRALCAAGLLGAGLLAPSASGQEQIEINFVSWGGAYAQSQIKAMIEPYMADNPHVKINVLQYSGGLTEIKAQVESSKVTWQVVDVTSHQGIAGCKDGLLEPLDKSTFPAGSDGTPAADDFVKGSFLDCFVGNISWSTVLAYNPKLVAGMPRTVKDFWDVRTYPGRRALRKVAAVNIEWSLEADGVARGDVYETLREDGAIDRAFASLDRLKPHAVWWEDGDEPAQMLADGVVTMASAWNGRLYTAIAEEGQPIETMWETQVFDMDGFVVPKGAANREEVMKFLHFATGTKALALATQYISYGPLRKSSIPFIAPEILPHLPTAPDNFTHALRHNAEWWADNAATINERFEAWLAK